MANSVGDRRESIAIWDAKTSYGAAWRQQSKPRVQFCCDVHDHEIGREESFVIFVDKALDGFKPSSFQQQDTGRADEAKINGTRTSVIRVLDQN